MTDRRAPLQDGNPQLDTSENDPRPIVALPRPGLSGVAIAAIGLLTALILFVALDAQRRRHAAAALSPVYKQSAEGFAPPPTLVVPPEPSPPPQTVTVVTQPAPRTPPPPPQPRSPAPAPFIPPVIVPTLPVPGFAPQPDRTARRSDQAIVYDNGPETPPTSSEGSLNEQAGRVVRVPGTAGAGGDDAPARAVLIGDKTNVMPTGTTVPAVLETPIDTARPGLLRAVVSQDTRGFDGKRVLIPRGSRLIGEYQSDVRANQHRVLVTWTRLIRPDGVTIRLGSPAADPLGGAGVPGQLHSYFLQRFASAVLQSALTVGVNLASRPGDNSVIVGLPGTTVNNVIGQTPSTGSSLQPKITVKQGAAVNVFVARDLDFSGVPSHS